MASHTGPSYTDFINSASEAVDRHIGMVRDRISRNELGPGMWHPNGFATFRVAMVDGLGLIRLHIWPVGHRRCLEGHPKIHCHSFHLYARVLIGVYQESCYSCSAIPAKEEPSHGGNKLRVYLVAPPRQEGDDRLVDTGEWVDVRNIDSEVRYPVGSWHGIEVGAYHATLIPAESLCATVALLGIPQQRRRDVLLGQPGFLRLENRRAAVTESEMKMMSAQCEASLEGREVNQDSGFPLK
jgi:hypothetical protein